MLFIRWGSEEIASVPGSLSRFTTREYESEVARMFKVDDLAVSGLESSFFCRSRGKSSN